MWLETRRRNDLDAATDQTLMRELLIDWSIGRGRMTSEAGRQFVRDYLAEEGLEDVEQFGAHSGKVTALNWVDSWGQFGDHRRPHVRGPVCLSALGLDRRKHTLVP